MDISARLFLAGQVIGPLMIEDANSGKPGDIAGRRQKCIEKAFAIADKMIAYDTPNSPKLDYYENNDVEQV